MSRRNGVSGSLVCPSFNPVLLSNLPLPAMLSNQPLTPDILASMGIPGLVELERRPTELLNFPGRCDNFKSMPKTFGPGVPRYAYACLYSDVWMRQHGLFVLLFGKEERDPRNPNNKPIRGGSLVIVCNDRRRTVLKLPCEADCSFDAFSKPRAHTISAEEVQRAISRLPTELRPPTISQCENIKIKRNSVLRKGTEQNGMPAYHADMNNDPRAWREILRPAIYPYANDRAPWYYDADKADEDRPHGHIRGQPGLANALRSSPSSSSSLRANAAEFKPGSHESYKSSQLSELATTLSDDEQWITRNANFEDSFYPNEPRFHNHTNRNDFGTIAENTATSCGSSPTYAPYQQQYPVLAQEVNRRELHIQENGLLSYTNNVAHTGWHQQQFPLLPQAANNDEFQNAKKGFPYELGRKLFYAYDDNVLTEAPHQQQFPVKPLSGVHNVFSLPVDNPQPTHSPELSEGSSTWYIDLTPQFDKFDDVAASSSSYGFHAGNRRRSSKELLDDMLENLKFGFETRLDGVAFPSRRVIAKYDPRVGIIGDKRPGQCSVKEGMRPARLDGHA